MKVSQLSIPGLLLVEPDIHGDARGFFMETWHRDRYSGSGLAQTFVQDNLSSSSKGVLRGLHYQLPFTQGKLVSVLEGEVFDVAVDIRRGSPTFGRWGGVLLNSEKRWQFYVPPGFAHGFEVVSSRAVFTYKCTDFYHPETEKCLLWNDPDIGIAWRTAAPLVSEKDGKARRLKDMPESELPVF